MKLTTHYLAALTLPASLTLALVLALSLTLLACGESSAPSCTDIAEQAVDRAVSESNGSRLPDRVRDDIRDNRSTLQSQAEQRCTARGWSKSVRRCKYKAATDLASAACESPKR